MGKPLGKDTFVYVFPSVKTPPQTVRHPGITGLFPKPFWEWEITGTLANS